jgi:nucleoid-associated protein YgaU
VIVGLAAVSLVSCTAFDPDYARYKEQQRNGNPADAGDPYSNVSNPYGVPSSGPQAGGEVGQYQPDPASAPYQPLPGVPSGNANGGYTIPGTGGGASAAPAPARVQTHVVARGDSLWGISKKYGASVEAIRQANGIEGNLIKVGQTLQIPR